MPAPVPIVIEAVERRVVLTRTRIPFHYGIASMTEAPHVFLRVRIRVEGRLAEGIAAEGLPPKWFTKDPHTTFEQDLPDLARTIRHASETACAAGGPSCYFDWWKTLTERQSRWAEERDLPPLLANLGVSLTERAVLDGLCRALETSFHRIVLENRLGLRLGEIHPELSSQEPADLLPGEPLRQIRVRHTVGLSDPLREAGIPDQDRVDDGLPQSLEAAIEAYGVDHFKVKVCGDLERDLPRLRDLEALFREKLGQYQLTLDGNEQFQDIACFRSHWDAWQADPTVAELLRHLLFVEQPLHRSRALEAPVGSALAGWKNAPPIIIDESDATKSSLPLALDLGYAGTSHKNCKGITKGLANACLLEHRRRRQPEAPAILSGEDLANIGPVALLQDLAVMSLLGIPHVERNGHHYFRGLSGFPKPIQEEVLRAHDDLYHRHEGDFPTVAIENGRIRLDSVVDAPFGSQTMPATDAFPAFDEGWLAHYKGGKPAAPNT